MAEVLAKSYTLRDENGQWLGQVVLTNDGMFSAVTDWGNFGYSWRAIGDMTFEEFLIQLNPEYFGDKLFTGMAYLCATTKVRAACIRFAKKILPPLQELLKANLLHGKS